MPAPLLIIGASGRAAAASALRAGFAPFVIDLFADADTRRLCPVLKCDPADYPHGFIPLANAAPPAPWMYTGGLENYPDVVAAISETRQLIGNGPDALRWVRDPYRLGALVRDAGGRFPETIPTGSGHPAGGMWLRKAVASAGGRHISAANPSDFNAPTDPRFFLQRVVAGQPISAIFRQAPGETHLFGLTRQLIGENWLHAPAFGYAGNITLRDRALVGRLFGPYAALDLRHAWGVDLMDVGDRVPVALEVNPRYTAAVEVLELATERPFLGPAGWTPAVRTAVGKAIYYAPRAITFPSSGPWDDSLSRCQNVWLRPDFADIPDPGATIDAGQPVLTILSEADTEAACETALRARAAELDCLFEV